MTQVNNERKLLMEIQNLSVEFKTKRGPLKAVKDASVTIYENESVALIGESGCGKTTLANAIVDILPLTATISSGKIMFHQENGKVENLLDMKKKNMRRLLWDQIAMMFQASQSSFNPVKKVRMDFLDTVRAHDSSKSSEEILKKSRELLNLVMLDDEKVLNSYPHELSGGMKQRALLALSLLLDPRLIILDEPTTALDILTQVKVLILLNKLKESYGFSYLFITHDLSLVSELADVVVTMYAGRIIEKAPVKEFFKNPKHPYSYGLIGAIPHLSLDQNELISIPGSPPDLIEIKAGCPFAPRCDRKLPRCTQEMPDLVPTENKAHVYACWNPIDGE
jgi:peptide/nickel transport system ATP-binding protein